MPLVDNEWDVILIGAGQNSFTLGTYLGMTGLKTVICESRLENGGRLATEEITLPGYWHNTLAYFQDYRDQSSVWKELGWDSRHHAEFVSPPVVSSLLFADGRSISYHQSLAETTAGIARCSSEDAASWRAAYARYHPLIREILIPYYHRPPEPIDVVVSRAHPNGAAGDFLRLWRTSAKAVAGELFRTDAVKTLVLSQMAIPRGIALDDDGGGIEVLKLIAGDEKPELARGGSHSIAQVLQRAYVHCGGQIRAVHHVDKIMVESGRATGVRLRDGREWKARVAVISDVHPQSTVEMIGEENLPRSFTERIRAVEPDEFSYFQVHLALKAPVRYVRHEENNPAIAQSLNVTVGAESSADLDAMWQEIRAGEFPQHLCLHTICPTVFDPLQAPRGKHAASAFLPVPFQLAGQRPSDWIKLKNRYMDSVLSVWRRYATNLTDDNIEMKVAMDPFYLSGRWNMRRGSVWGMRKSAGQMGEHRPLKGFAEYRTPIERLYQIGVATHPADAVIGGSGRNAWGIIKRDLKL
jgi:phytoene dehydrogenase-like protein